MRNKIFSLRKWLSLEDAATYLSGELEEEITTHDICMFIIEEKVKLHVRLPEGVYGKIGGQCDKKENPSPDGVEYFGYYSGLGYIKAFSRLIKIEDELLELPYKAGGKRIIRILESNTRSCLSNTGLTDDDVAFDELILKREKGDYIIPYESSFSFEESRSKWLASWDLPKDARAGVLVEELKKFINQIKDSSLNQSLSKPFRVREKNSMLRTIAGLLLVLKSKGMSEAQAIKWLDEQGYSDMEGLSKSTLEARFAEAKRVIQD